MSHKTQMAADVKTFLNTDENADLIYYNGATAGIAAVVDIGEDIKGNEFSASGAASTMIINVACTAIPSPAIGVAVIHNSRTWRTAKLLGSDSAMHRIECTASESAW